MNNGLRDASQSLNALRKRVGLSIRQLAARSSVSAGMISFIERGKTSPSLATLQKILHALGTNLGTFFSGGREDQLGPVFLREQMKTVRDDTRSHALVFPRRAGIAVQLFDETLSPRKRPEFETLTCDVGGYVLAGTLRFETKGEKPRTLRAGDAFYVPKGVTHRGFAVGAEPVRLISLCSPPDY
jgi:transcriptional regulator with XRE-family HTH domain